MLPTTRGVVKHPRLNWVCPALRTSTSPSTETILATTGSQSVAAGEVDEHNTAAKKIVRKMGEKRGRGMFFIAATLRTSGTKT
jgi:hypothetical protein